MLTAEVMLLPVTVSRRVGGRVGRGRLAKDPLPRLEDAPAAALVVVETGLAEASFVRTLVEERAHADCDAHELSCEMHLE